MMLVDHTVRYVASLPDSANAVQTLEDELVTGKMTF